MRQGLAACFVLFCAILFTGASNGRGVRVAIAAQPAPLTSSTNPKGAIVTVRNTSTKVAVSQNGTQATLTIGILKRPSRSITITPIQPSAASHWFLYD